MLEVLSQITQGQLGKCDEPSVQLPSCKAGIRYWQGSTVASHSPCAGTAKAIICSLRRQMWQQTQNGRIIFLVVFYCQHIITWCDRNGNTELNFTLSGTLELELPWMLLCQVVEILIDVMMFYCILILLFSWIIRGSILSLPGTFLYYIGLDQLILVVEFNYVLSDH